MTRWILLLNISALLTVGNAQDASRATGANEDMATLTVRVTPNSTPIALAGVTLTGESVSLELTSDVEVKVTPGAYVLEVQPPDASGDGGFTRALQLLPGETFELTYELSQPSAATGSSRVTWWMLLSMVALVTLLSGGMILYFRSLQLRYYSLVASMVGRVATVEAEMVTTMSAAHGAPAVEGKEAAALAGSGNQEERTRTLEIEYPQIVPVGATSRPFTVRRAYPAGTKFSWSLEPQDLATIQPREDGSSATVSAAKAGVLRVTATAVADGIRYEGTAETIAFAAPMSEKFTLPWVGQGVGAFVVTVLVLGVAMLLALAGLLDPTHVNTLLVALAGFAFGYAQVSK